MCHRQLAQLRNSLNEIENLDAELLAVDPHEAWSAKYLLKEVGLSTDDVQFPLLMDPSLTVSANYGVPFQMRIHVEWSSRPTTFVIDKEGVIRFIKRSATYSDRPKPAEIVAELKKL